MEIAKHSRSDVLSLLLMVAASPLVQAAHNEKIQQQAKIEQKIVIHNVTFVDPRNKEKQTIANIVIANKRFDLVTQDKVKVEHSDIVFDAQQGYLIGSLEPEEIANFMILDKDPHNLSPEQLSYLIYLKMKVNCSI